MRQEKELLKQDISNKITKHNSFVILQYTGLTANAANDLRRDLRQLGGDLEVVRKRVMLKAVEDSGISLEEFSLDGHIGLVFLGADPVETTKAVFKFNQSRGNTLQVIGGRFDGKLYGGIDVEALSKLPGKDEMRAQLLGLFEAPMSQTLAVVEALLTSVAYCLDNKCKEDGGNTEGSESNDSES